MTNCFVFEYLLLFFEFHFSHLQSYKEICLLVVF